MLYGLLYIFLSFLYAISEHNKYHLFLKQLKAGL